VSATEPRRGPGRPPRSASVLAAVPQPEPEKAASEPVSALQRLSDLEALRQQHGGLPLPMPDSIHGAASSLPHEALGGDGMHVPNRAMKEADAFFAKLAEIGTPQDLDLARAMWRTAEGIANPKPAFEARFNALKDTAGRRFKILWEQAEAERRQGLARLEHRDRAADLRRQIVDAEREVARLKTLLANHEREAKAA
jgi:hypothetical protein